MIYNMKDNKKEGVDLGLRQFIKSLGYVAGGTALLATTPWLTSCTPEKLKEIKHEKARIALIGTGSRGQYHIHNLKEIPHAQIVAVCDNYAPNLQQALELCPDAKSYTDYRKLLESKDIDGVIISTPLNWHAPIVLDALAAGKHVFCEKAMDNQYPSILFHGHSPLSEIVKNMRQFMRTCSSTYRKAVSG